MPSIPGTANMLSTLRAAPRFRPSVLGPDVGSRVGALPEATRQRLLGSIASESGVDGIDLATDLAKIDPSPEVQADVVGWLLFRRADRHVASLLSVAHEETWGLVAQRGYTEQIRDAAAIARLRRHGRADRLGRKRNLFDRARARRLRAEGWSIRQIAAELGQSAMTIQRAVSAAVV